MNIMTKRKWVSIAFASALVGASLSGPVRSGVSQTYEEIRLLVDILQLVKTDYVEERGIKDLVYGAAAGLVRTQDPFSQFMEPDQYRERQTETKGEFGGLGIRIGVRDGWLVVLTPIEDTPAYRLGILPQDKIVKIDGESTQ